MAKVVMSKKEYNKEHKRLISTLEKGSKQEQKKEAEKQRREQKQQNRKKK